MSFEVGKKYKSVNGSYIYECLWTDESHALLKQKRVHTPFLMQQNAEDWYEYVEPLKKIEYVYEIEGKLQVLATPHNDNTGRLKYISTIELTFDIHNGLKVEVIPGIG
jgi:hypothetical protein